MLGRAVGVADSGNDQRHRMFERQRSVLDPHCKRLFSSLLERQSQLIGLVGFIESLGLSVRHVAWTVADPPVEDSAVGEPKSMVSRLGRVSLEGGMRAIFNRQDVIEVHFVRDFSLQHMIEIDRPARGRKHLRFDQPMDVNRTVTP